MSNRKELFQRINSFNSLLEKMKIDVETISIKFIRDDFEDIKKLNSKLNGIYDELTLCYEKEVAEIRKTNTTHKLKTIRLNIVEK